jgi:glycosyltransferase involved in cell wall biosynthesis
MNEKPMISVVISAFNEEDKIKDCLDSIKNLATEIVFVDNSSSDKTPYIAKRYTGKVYTVKNNPMLNVNKNYGFLKATGEWILSLDADERVTQDLASEIKSEIRNPKSEAIGYWIPRKNIIFGKWIQHSIWWPDYQLRLFRNGKGRFPEIHVHEYIDVEGKTEKLKNHLEHINYTNISQYIYKMDKIYTESEAQKIVSIGKELGWIDAIRFPANDFIKTFFAQKGYKDGLHGLVLSILQALYAEVVFAKVWERQGFRKENSPAFLKEMYKEIKSIVYEFKYWLLTCMLDETKNPFKKIAYKLARKRLTRKIVK